MTGFEPRTSGINSDRSTNLATTTAQYTFKVTRLLDNIPRITTFIDLMQIPFLGTMHNEQIY